MGNIVNKKVNGTWTPVDEDEWNADKGAVVAEVLRNRAIMERSGPDTSKEAKRLLKENALPEQDFDPKDFGDQTITSPPKAGEK